MTEAGAGRGLSELFRARILYKPWHRVAATADQREIMTLNFVEGVDFPPNARHWSDLHPKVRLASLSVEIVSPPSRVVP